MIFKMTFKMIFKSLLLTLSLLLTTACSGGSSESEQADIQDKGEVNLYSSRHYDTDLRLYSDFTDKTGIKVNRIEAKSSALIERIKSEG